MDAGDQVILQHKLDEKEAEINELKKQLDALNNQESENDPVLASTRQRQTDQLLREKMREIDFAHAKEMLYRTILHPQKAKRPFASFLLLHDSEDKAGDLCLLHIKKELSSRNFRQITVQFGFKPFNTQSFLNELAAHFKVDSLTDLEAYAEAIIDTICAALSRSSIFFFEFNLQDDPFYNELFPQELITIFWQPLLTALEEVRTDKPLARLVFCFVIDPTVQDHFLQAPHFCPSTEFQIGKILHLPLALWSVEDINQWLLELDLEHLPVEDILDLAQRIHRTSGKGLPRKITRAILKNEMIRSAI